MYDTSTQSSSNNFGVLMVTAGSIILIIIGGLAMLGIFSLIWYPLYALTAFWWGLSIFIIGILGASSAKWTSRGGVAIWLILLAFAAGILGAWWASWLIGIGAVIGLLVR